MRVLVFELGSGGHRFTYLRHIVPVVADLGCHVVVQTSQQAAASSEFQGNRQAMAEHAEIDTSGELSEAGFSARGRQKVFYLRKAVAKYRPDHVYLPSADGMIQILGIQQAFGRAAWRRGIEFEAGIHGCRFAYREDGWRSRVSGWISLKAMLQAKMTRLHFVDINGFEHVRRHVRVAKGMAQLLPDPVKPAEQIGVQEARRNLGVPEDGRYLGCVGVIEERKGLDRLIAAFAGAPRGDDDRLLLVGQHTPGIAKLLQMEFRPLVESRSIVSIDRFVDERELALGLSSLDLVCTPYRQATGISSIAIRAAGVGRPVLAVNRGWMQAIIPRLGLGWTCDISDRQAFGQALMRHLDLATEYKPPEEARRFAAFHTPANFIATWTQRLRERLELPAAAGAVAWKSVIKSSLSAYV